MSWGLPSCPHHRVDSKHGGAAGSRADAAFPAESGAPRRVPRHPGSLENMFLVRAQRDAGKCLPQRGHWCQLPRPDGEVRLEELKETDSAESWGLFAEPPSGRPKMWAEVRPPHIRKASLHPKPLDCGAHGGEASS